MSKYPVGARVCLNRWDKSRRDENYGWIVQSFVTGGNYFLRHAEYGGFTTVRETEICHRKDRFMIDMTGATFSPGCSIRIDGKIFRIKGDEPITFERLQVTEDGKFINDLPWNEKHHLWDQLTW